jgi:hypothetical protein
MTIKASMAAWEPIILLYLDVVVLEDVSGGQPLEREASLKYIMSGKVLKRAPRHQARHSLLKI